MKRFLLALCLCWLAAGVLPASLAARESIRLAKTPALSPDGALLAFEWNGDIWVASSHGGEARQLTTHPGKDSHPKFSPDGKEIAFVSDREGGAQVFVVPVTGGSPQQVTFHTAGHELQEWTPDGKSLLVKGVRDHFWRHGERFFIVPRHERGPEKLLFDDFGNDGALSADGRKILFTREGEPWWRKGYHGPRAPQLWMHDLDAKQFTKLVHKDYGSRWPLWKSDGSGFYFVQEHAKGSNLCSFDLASPNATPMPLTSFKEEAVVFPCIARDGSAIVFRHLFDLYRLNPSTKEMKKLDLWHSTDRPRAKQDRRVLTSATAVAFAQDGLEIAFIAGGDLWVMDTELREPVQITKTAEEETFPVFAGDTLYFVSGAGGKHAIWKAARKDAKKFWWQNSSFDLAKLTTFDDVPSQLKLSPDGKTLAYVRGRGDLHLLNLETNKDTKLFAGWSSPDYAWSPDGKWIVHSQSDSDFNQDVWVRPVDGSRKPYNLSRHPYNEGRPAWSPDGRWIAFAGQRASGEPGANVCIVALREDEDEKTERDRKLEKALEKMKGRTGGAGKFPKVGEEGKLPEKKGVEVVIDFDRLHERVKRVTLTDGSAGSLFWSPDSKKLAFTGSFEGKPGTYTIDMGEKLTPKQLTTTVGQQPVWLRQGNQIVWLVGGVPSSTPGVAAAPPVATPTPTPTPGPTPKKGGGLRLGGGGASVAAGPGAFTFSVRQEIDVPARHAAIFDTCWRIMRDNWYDSNLGNSDWNAVRAKYRDMASQSPDMEGVTTVVQLMLGELNGSHLGFTAMSAADLPGLGGITPKTAAVRDVTGHLGVRFDLSQPGPGLKIRDVLAGGPADKKRSKLRAGETILRIDGTPVGPDSDLAKLLTRPADREVELVVKDAKGEERTVSLAPTTYAAAQQLLYDHWLRHNRQKVDELSGGKLGYLHISAMSMPSFRKFEEELVSEGSGRDGLVIDVRENGGGSTTDHLLTALTQPVHAITVPRGGGPGYPHDRKVYMTWSKPIIVLCNQNSYSNAEIFSHAIKNLKRGQVVGVPTAGGVVSTGVAQVMDVGTLRLPTRGWFLVTDGKDMELNGCVPHHVLWPQPGEMPRGSDAQLSRAVEVLLGDVQAWSQRPQPKLRKTTEAP